MHILFVCTGNQCRSVMAEYYTRNSLAKRGLSDPATGITVSSAGTLHYPPHPADPIVVDLLAADDIDASAHRSTILTPTISSSADLILCFEREQISDLLEQNPLAGRKVLLFNDFVNVCQHLRADGPIAGNTVSDRLFEAKDCVSMIRPFLPKASETEDPHRKSRDVFERVYSEIKQGVDGILNAVA